MIGGIEVKFSGRLNVSAELSFAKTNNDAFTWKLNVFDM